MNIKTRLRENLLLNEIGEGNAQPYKIQGEYFVRSFNGDNYIYDFTTDSGINYSIVFTMNPPESYFLEEDVHDCHIINDNYIDFLKNIVLVAYVVRGDLTGEEVIQKFDFDETIITNKNEMFKILSTVKKLLLKFIQAHNNIKYLFFGGSGYGLKKDQREKLYLKYIISEIPNVKPCDIYLSSFEDYFPIAKIK